MRTIIAIALSCVLLVGCKKKPPTTAPPATADAPPLAAIDAGAALPTAGVAIVADKMVEDKLGASAAAALGRVVGPADPACAAPNGKLGYYTAFHDAKARRWVVAMCDAGDAHALVLIAGFPDQPVAGAVTAWSDDDRVILGLEAYELAGAPLICVLTAWSNREHMREGWDTDCVRDVGGKLTAVYAMGDTSLADGTTSAFTVHPGPPEEIRDLVDCDDCEVCALEDDCTMIPAGVQRYEKRLIWNGATFAAQGDRVRVGAAPP